KASGTDPTKGVPVHLLELVLVRSRRKNTAALTWAIPTQVAEIQTGIDLIAKNVEWHSGRNGFFICNVIFIGLFFPRFCLVASSDWCSCGNLRFCGGIAVTALKIKSRYKYV